MSKTKNTNRRWTPGTPGNVKWNTGTKCGEITCFNGTIYMVIIWRLYRIILRWKILVGGATTILKNDGVRQWEGWHPIYEMENNPFMFETTNQNIIAPTTWKHWKKGSSLVLTIHIYVLLRLMYMCNTEHSRSHVSKNKVCKYALSAAWSDKKSGYIPLKLYSGCLKPMGCWVLYPSMKSWNQSPAFLVQSYENWLLKIGVPTVNPCITR